MKILVLLSRVPWPLEKGDKLRAYHQLRELSVRHDLVLFAIAHHPPHPEALTQLKKFCRSVHIVRTNWLTTGFNMLRAWLLNRPAQSGYFFSHRAASKLKSIYLSEKPDHTYCQLARMAEYAKAIPGSKTIDYQDVFSEGVRRRMERVAWWMKPFLRIEYQRMVRYEASLFDLFDGHTIISEADRDLIRHPEKQSISIIENGVDTDFFHEIAAEKKYDIVFTGNMSYPPNILAAEFLVRQILPECRKAGIDPTLLLAGANPAPRVKSLASEKVTISGWIDDIRQSYASSRLFMAPMQIGTGLQNKLLEAMAMRTPCICSPLANGSLKAEPGVEILIGQTPAEYASHIGMLLNNKELADKLATSGQQYVQRHFNWTASVKRLEQVFDQTGANK